MRVCSILPILAFILSPSILRPAGHDSSLIKHDDTLDPIPYWASTEWHDEVVGALRMQGWELTGYTTDNERDSIGSTIRSYIPAYALYYAARGTRGLTMRLLGWERLTQQPQITIVGPHMTSHIDSIARMIVWMRYDDSTGRTRWALLDVAMIARHNGERQWDVPELTGGRELPVGGVGVEYDTIHPKETEPRETAIATNIATKSRRGSRSNRKGKKVGPEYAEVEDMPPVVSREEAVKKIDQGAETGPMLVRIEYSPLRTFDHPPSNAEINQFILDAMRRPRTLFENNVRELRPTEYDPDILLESFVREKTWSAVTGEIAPMFFPNDE